VIWIICSYPAKKGMSLMHFFSALAELFVYVVQVQTCNYVTFTESRHGCVGSITQGMVLMPWTKTSCWQYFVTSHIRIQWKHTKLQLTFLCDLACGNVTLHFSNGFLGSGCHITRHVHNFSVLYTRITSCGCGCGSTSNLNIC